MEDIAGLLSRIAELTAVLPSGNDNVVWLMDAGDFKRELRKFFHGRDFPFLYTRVRFCVFFGIWQSTIFFTYPKCEVFFLIKKGKTNSSKF